MTDAATLEMVKTVLRCAANNADAIAHEKFKSGETAMYCLWRDKADGYHNALIHIITSIENPVVKPASKWYAPDMAVKWRKWTFGFWTDPANWTRFGIDIGPVEIIWRSEGYRQ